MNSWSETIKLPKALRDVGLATAADAASHGRQPSPEELRASYERGRIDGEKALSEQLLQQRAETQQLLNGLLASLREAAPQVIRDTEDMLVALALEVAQKIVADVPISATMVEAVVRDALAQVEGTARFTVQLHPADLELLREANASILVSGDNAGEFRFVASPEITRGGCLVQTRFGTVDARRETKFELLKKNLLAA